MQHISAIFINNGRIIVAMKRYNPSLQKIKRVLKKHPRGLTVMEISKIIEVSRNSVAKYMDVLLISGKVEMKNVGPAKIFFLSHRVPASSILDFSSDAILTIDENLKVIQTNDIFLTKFNCTEKEIVGVTFGETSFCPYLNKELSTEIKKALKGETIRKEIKMQISTKIHCFKASLIPSTFNDGLHGVTIFFEEITEQKQAEKKLFSFLEAIPVGVFVLTVDGKPYYVNEEAVELLGKGVLPNATKEELSEIYQIYKEGTDILYPTKELPAVKALNGKKVIVEDMELEKDGKRIPIKAWAQPIYGDDGNISYSIVAFAKR
jgi:PAS domain S-box-containing protein